MSDAANAAGGASAPTAISSSGKREFVPTPKVQAQTQSKESTAPKADDPYAQFRGTKHKVQVDGKDEEVDYDEMRRGYQKAQASARRFQQAAELEKQSKPVLEALERKDIKFLVDKLGRAEAKELMENFLIAEMEEENLKRENPSEFRARELEKKLKEKEDKENAEKEKAEKAEKEATLKKAHEDLDMEVGEALKALKRKPTPRLVVRIIDEMMAKMSGKDELLTADKASQKAISGIHEDIREYVPQLSIEELIEVLGPDQVKRISEHQANQLLSHRSQIRTKPSEQRKAPAQKSVGIDDWINNKINKAKQA